MGLFTVVQPPESATTSAERPDKEAEIPEVASSYEDMMFHNAVIFQFILCAGVSVALGLLLVWHARLISRGETSIEAHINAKQRKRYRKKGLVSVNVSKACGCFLCYCSMYV